MAYKKIITSSVVPRKNDNLIVGTYFFQTSPTFSKACLIKGIKCPCWCHFLWTLSYYHKTGGSCSLDTSHPLSTCERFLQGQNTSQHMWRQDNSSRKLVVQSLNTNDPSLGMTARWHFLSSLSWSSPKWEGDYWFGWLISCSSKKLKGSYYWGLMKFALF